MSRTTCSFADFSLLVQPLLGLPISRPWQGYGSAIFLELGALHGAPRQSGEAVIAVFWDWRVEEGSSVLFGSSNTRPSIARGLERLRDASIISIEAAGDVPEISLRLSNGLRLRSMVMVTGDPEWSIRLPDGRYLSALEGCIKLGDGSDRYEMSAEELADSERADQASARWQQPREEPAGGDCHTCKFFVAVDGDWALLDYGVCTSGASSFDGRVVHRLSACPAHEPA